MYLVFVIDNIHIGMAPQQDLPQKSWNDHLSGGNSRMVAELSSLGCRIRIYK
jgi:hypothetical protein